MPQYHADPAIVPTPGARGKTTRRKSTRTVRGPEGRWIAQMKEALACDRPPGPLPVLGVLSTIYLVTCPHPSGRHVHEYEANAFWRETEDEALRLAYQFGPAARVQRKQTVSYLPPRCRKPRLRHEWSDIPVTE